MTADDFDDALKTILRPVARAKLNNTPGAGLSGTPKGTHGRAARLQRIARVVQRTPEVMVRITGKTRGARHIREHLNYITRNGKLAAEDEEGAQVTGKDAVRATANAWQQGDAGNRRANSRDTVNLALSMPPGTDRDRLRNAVRSFAARNFAADRQYLFVRHDDTDHPHCHLTLKSVGYDGRRLNPRKADLQAWRESFAACLREQGIAAEATPRRARGVVRKGLKPAVYHAKQAGRSTVAKAQIDAAWRVGGEAPGTRPWEAAIQRRQRNVRNDWLAAAAQLETSQVPAAVTLASKLREFVAAMPPIQTEQQALAAKMREHLARQQAASRSDPEPSRER